MNSTSCTRTSNPPTFLLRPLRRPPQIKVADFGSASLLVPERLGALGITNLGFTQSSAAEGKALTGTLMYIAPEVLAGQLPTATSDVYSLGVLLYQLIAGDFRKPIAAGWEADIADPVSARTLRTPPAATRRGG